MGHINALVDDPFFERQTIKRVNDPQRKTIALINMMRLHLTLVTEKKN